MSEQAKFLEGNLLKHITVMSLTASVGLVNAVLDPILIFGLDLDLTAAALESVAARIAIAFVALSSLLHSYGGLDRPILPQLRIDFLPVLSIAPCAGLAVCARRRGREAGVLVRGAAGAIVLFQWRSVRLKRGVQ